MSIVPRNFVFLGLYLAVHFSSITFSAAQVRGPIVGIWVNREEKISLNFRPDGLLFVDASRFTSGYYRYTVSPNGSITISDRREPSRRRGTAKLIAAKLRVDMSDAHNDKVAIHNTFVQAADYVR